MNRRFTATSLVVLASAALLAGCHSSDSTDTTDSSTTTPSSSLSSPTKNPTDKHSARIPAAAAQNGVTHKCGVVEGQHSLCEGEHCAVYGGQGHHQYLFA